MSDIPVIINVRDRVTPLRLLVDWLERAEHDRLILVDNDSAWPPLLDYLDRSPHEVLRLGANIVPHAPWNSGLIRARFNDEPYVVTDPDVVPDESCPMDAVEQLLHLLTEQGADKVGLGLRVDDLPRCYAHRDVVLALESHHWDEANRLGPLLFRAPVDTTFAIYAPGRPFSIDGALRTGPPLLARHLGWYDDSNEANAERDFYRDRARPGSVHWDLAELPRFIREEHHLRASGGRGAVARTIRARRSGRAVRARIAQAVSWHVLRRR